jgi:hypothetical protein
MSAFILMCAAEGPDESPGTFYRAFNRHPKNARNIVSLTTDEVTPATKADHETQENGEINPRPEDRLSLTPYVIIPSWGTRRRLNGLRALTFPP